MTQSVGENATTGSPAADEVTADQAADLFEHMTRIRHFEEQVNELYKGAKMPGLAHLYVGRGGGGGRASARRCGATTSSRARTAATATAWPRARR